MVVVKIHIVKGINNNKATPYVHIMNENNKSTTTRPLTSTTAGTETTTTIITYIQTINGSVESEFHVEAIDSHGSIVSEVCLVVPLPLVGDDHVATLSLRSCGKMN